jgi:predicted dehydrogenase
MSAAPIRIAMLSFAHMHAFSYASCLRQLDGAEIVGIWHEEAVRGQELADHFGAPFVADADALLDEQPDGVVICSANAHHRRDVERAAGRARAILCEKPIAATLADGQWIIDRCQATNTRLQIAFPVRFSPLFQQIKAMLDRGDLGRILGVECTNHGSMPGGWFVDQALAGGGAVLDHTVHVIDLLRWFWGSEVVEVYAEVGDSLLHPGLGIDDAGLLSFTLDNGVYGTLDTSWSRPKSYPTWGDVKLEIVGDKGVVYADLSRQHLSVSSGRAGKTQWIGAGGNMDLGLMADFVAMLREDRAPSISGEDGLAALAVALAAYRSAELGQAVKVGE